MEVPLLDLKRQYDSIKDEIDSAIQRVVDSQYFILGDEVEGFEEEVADYSGPNTQLASQVERMR